ncbi:MAG: restriction endonuclease subunit S, partial [Dehalococcoidia bacterium]|nr:restriction endonuclease subunit S [Dehalococcoidia bacterium]
IDTQYLKYHDPSRKVKDDIFIKKGDIVLNSTGDITIGRAYYFKRDWPNLFVDSHVTILRLNRSILLPEFCIYLFPTEEYQAKIYGLVTGATGQLELNKTNIQKLEVLVPPLPIQRKIAAILSAYDDLIENNMRRIKTLEEIAQLIYREWFVNFRFPGYEKVRMVASELGKIPEGWEVRTVKQSVTRLKSRNTYTEATANRVGIVPIIDQSRNSFLGFHNGKPDHLATADNPVIIFGDHTCKMQLMVEPFSVGPNVVPFTSRDDIPIHFLYFSVRNLVKTQEYKRHWTDLMVKKLAITPTGIAKRFAKLVASIFEEMNVLLKKNLNLEYTRDLLLPKLIYGELDVSKLDIDVGGEAE